MPLKLSFDRRSLTALVQSVRENGQVESIYDRYAKHIHVLFGGVTESLPYRRKAIARLNIAQNSSVLDVACGIGSNFRIIEGYLRDTGTLVGIDISSESLKIAKKMVAKHNWTNVQLVNTNITEYRPKKRFDAILCTFALEIITDYRSAIDNIFELLTPNGRFVMLGMKSRNGWPNTKVRGSETIRIKMDRVRGRFFPTRREIIAQTGKSSIVTKSIRPPTIMN